MTLRRTDCLLLAALALAAAAPPARAQSAGPVQAGATARAAGALTPALPAAPIDYTQESAEDKARRMAWFNHDRFGMFIHWGLYAVPAGAWGDRTDYGEWIMEQARIPVSEYEKFADQFNPTKFDADAWARMAKDAGMKYIVLTSKHHEGFALWPTKQSDWSIERTPFGRDPVAELAAACRRHGLRFAFYHSIMDWYHPAWETRRAWNDVATGSTNMEEYIPFMKAQLKELVENYGPLGIMWFDGEWESPWTHERGVDLYNYVRSLQPDILINNRVGKGRAGMSGMDQGQGVGDFGTPEQEVPGTGFAPGVYWESCMTMGDTWGYNATEDNWKSSRQLIHHLIDAASKGGNYLLNVGPTAEGLFPQESIDRLADIGRWMKVNSEAIYGTTASPIATPAWGRITQKRDRLYLHVFDAPADGQLVLPLQANVRRAYLLADRRQAVTTAQTPAGLTVTLPASLPDADATVIALETRGAVTALD